MHIRLSWVLTPTLEITSTLSCVPPPVWWWIPRTFPRPPLALTEPSVGPPDADADTLWVIEGAASYGAILTGTLASHGYPVAEAPRMDAKQRYGVGKSDTLNAHRIAAAALPVPVDKLRRPRLNDGIRQAIQILVTARNAITKDRTRSINALTALLRSNNLGMDARKALNKAQVAEVVEMARTQRRAVCGCCAG